MMVEGDGGWVVWFVVGSLRFNELLAIQDNRSHRDGRPKNG